MHGILSKKNLAELILYSTDYSLLNRELDLGGDPDLIYSYQNKSNSLLHLAAGKSDSRALEILLKYNPLQNKNAQGSTPLERAIVVGVLDNVKLLIGAGANTEIQTYENEDMLFLACRNVFPRNNPTHGAAIIKYLFESGRLTEESFSKTNTKGLTAWGVAKSCNNLRACDEINDCLIKIKNSSKNDLDSNESQKRKYDVTSNENKMQKRNGGSSPNFFEKTPTSAKTTEILASDETKLSVTLNNQYAHLYKQFYECSPINPLNFSQLNSQEKCEIIFEFSNRVITSLMEKPQKQEATSHPEKNSKNGCLSFNLN